MKPEEERYGEATAGYAVEAEHRDIDADGREVRVIDRATVVEVSLVRRDPRAQRPPRGAQRPT